MADTFARRTDIGSLIRFLPPLQKDLGVLDLSVPCVIGEFISGPMNQVVEVYNEAELNEIFVGADHDSEAYLQIQLAFRFYAPKKIVVIRTVGYTDIADLATISADKASLTQDNGTDDIITSEFPYYGTDGNFWSVETTHTNKVSKTLSGAITATDTYVDLTNVVDIEIGEILEFSEGLNTEYFKVTDIVQTRVYLSGAFVNAYTTAATVKSLNYDFMVYYKGVLQKTYRNVTSEVENKANYVTSVVKALNVTVEDLTGVALADRRPTDNTGAPTPLGGGTAGNAAVTADYIGNQANKSGLYALEEYGEGRLPVVLTIPDQDNATFAAACQTFVEDKKIHYYIADAPIDYDHDDIIDYADNVAQINSKFISMFFPALKIENPDVAGDIINIHNSTFMAARWAKTDREGSGVWQNSAGVNFGVLPGVIGLVEHTFQGELKVLTQDQDIRNELTASKINPIYKKGIDFINQGTFNRNTGRTVEYVHQSQTRTMQYIGANVDFRYTDEILIKNHTISLEKDTQETVEAWIDRTIPPTAFFGASAPERRRVICDESNNPRIIVDGQKQLEFPEQLVTTIEASLTSPVLQVIWELRKTN